MALEKSRKLSEFFLSYFVATLLMLTRCMIDRLLQSAVSLYVKVVFR